MNRGPRLVTVSLALVAAGLLAIAVQGGRWWDVSGGLASIGPVSSKHCLGAACKVAGLEWVGAGAGWIRAGTATYAAGLIAAALLVISAAGLAARKEMTRRRRLLARSGLVAAITAAVAGGFFVGLYPQLDGSAIGRGLWCFAGGLVLALVAQVAVMRAPIVEPTP